MTTYLQNSYASFVGGLITEAGELQFPENASVDELNCDLLRDGSRRRRLGMEFETGYVLSDQTAPIGTTISVGRWTNVAEQPGVEFVVVQINTTLVFYQQTNNLALSNSKVNTTFASSTQYTVDLTTFQSSPSSNVGGFPVQMATIKGALVVASSAINTFYITRDTDTGAFTETEISFKIRDFEYIGDIETYSEPSENNNLRRYDTKNCGWVAPPNGTSPLNTYSAAHPTFVLPPLTHPWFSGLDANGNFSVSEWEEIFGGTSLITNGHYILDLYERDRETAANVNDVNPPPEEARFSCLATFAGRVFYSGMSGSTADNGSKIFFSQLLEFGFAKLGRLHSVNDPTARDLNDLLDTDGGYITIAEARNISRLHVFGSALYVFAENGVWRISGVDDVFRATEYSVSKISEDGLAAQGSFVNAQGRPYWWSNTGIFTFVTDEVGNIIPRNLSISSIQTYWEENTGSTRNSVRGVYDELKRRVIWLYSSSGEEIEEKKNEVLIFDEVLQAFFPWRISDAATNTPYIVDAVYESGVTDDEIDFQVVDSNNNNVVDSLGNNVIVTRRSRELSQARIKFLTVDSATSQVTFSEPTSITFLDWGEANYESYVEAAYNLLQDLESRKTTTFVTTYCHVTETGFALNDAGDGYDPVRPSSLLISSYWDFAKDRTSTQQQVYRLKRPVVVDVTNLNTFNYPEDFVVSRVKLRGRGRVVKMRFDSEQGKDFHIAGYNVISNSVGRF